MGALNVCGRFFLPALSPATQNLVLVAGGSVLAILGLTEDRALLPWAALLLLGGAVQFAVQLPALRREGWRPQWRPDVFFKSPAVREIAKRMGPVVLGMAATHISILINTRLASQFTGGVSYLYYGFRMVHLPVGLVGVAVATVTLAQASKHAAKGDLDGVRTTMGDSMRLCLAFALPAAAGLFVLAHPLAQLLFRHGATAMHDAMLIGETIRVYALAVVSYCCVKVMVPVFFALGRVRVPVIASLIAVAANLTVALTLSRDPQWEWKAMALAVGVGQAFNLIVLMVAARRVFPEALPGFLGSLAKILVATAGCGAAAAALLHALPWGTGLGERAVRALVPTFGGAAAYFALGWALRCEEIRAVLLRRRG
jgi:putative peptidoglycan lipid II flippase